jgi:hypothetical protein
LSETQGYRGGNERIRAMRSFFMWLLLSVLVGALAGCANDLVEGAPGTLSINLVVGQGVDVAEIDYEINGNGVDPITGKIAVESNLVTAAVAGIPSGTGYTINLFTPAGASVSCSGSATFNVIANQTTTVQVQIECGALPGGRGTIDITAPINTCPILTAVVASPTHVDVGGTIYVNATVKNLSLDALTYAWTATAGTFADASAAKTTYTCSEAGSRRLTIKVVSGCSDSLSVEVKCGAVVTQIPPERASEPIVVSGAALPALFCVPPSQIFVFSYRQGQWKQIPHQVDERQEVGTIVPNGVWETIFPCSEECELRYVFVGEEGNGLDADDEVVFLAADLGEPAPASAPPPEGTQGAGYQVEVTLSGGASVGFASIYASMSLAKDFGPAQVSYSRAVIDTSHEDTTIRTSRYQIHFSRNWVLDALEVLAGGGGDGTDLIDRWKGRFPVGGETEDMWSETSGYMGAINGPVRAVREIIGAMSWPLTTRVDLFYPARAETIFNLNGHRINSVESYWDYALAATPLTYYNPLIPGGTIIDGVPDPAYPNRTGDAGPQFEQGWDQVDSAHGGIVFAFQSDVPGPIVPFFLDDVGFNDGTGDDPAGQPGVVGGNGLQGLSPVSPGLVRFTYWPMHANAGNVGASFFSTVQTPLGIAVTPRSCNGKCTPIITMKPCCGDGVVEAPETCDKAIIKGQPGSCRDCDLCTEERTSGNPLTCNLVCSSRTPITVCGIPDRCCPGLSSNCTLVEDIDCSAICGDGLPGPGENCDTAIAAGQPGACPTSCANDYPCMATTTLRGDACQALCVHENPITACNNNDGCCPNGCDSNSDNDCSALIDPVGTWTMRIQTKAEMNTPKIFGTFYNANVDIIQRMVMSKSTDGSQLNFMLEICSLNTWEDKPIDLSIGYTPILNYLNQTKSILAQPLYVNSPMPLPTFSLYCGIDQNGNSVDTDNDKNPGISLPVSTQGLSPVAYLGFDMTETFATTLVVDKDTFTGTINALINGRMFGIEGQATTGPSPIVVTPYPAYSQFTAKRLTGDVPCSEVLKNFP